MIDPASPAGHTLIRLSEVMAAVGVDGIVIGSAAVALLGAKTQPADIDLLLAPDDGRRLLDRLGIAPLAPDRDPRFRSALYARWTDTPLPVEIMADLRLAEAGGWHRLHCATRRVVQVGPARLHVPEPAELHAILHRFGRTKDLERARLLDGLT